MINEKQCFIWFISIVIFLNSLYKVCSWFGFLDLCGDYVDVGLNMMFSCSLSGIFFFFSIFEVSICLFYGEVGVSLVI